LRTQNFVVRLLNAIRPNVVALVDAFDIPDRVLNSAIGRFDGNVYEALYKSAQLSSLNKTVS
jgi:acyl-CoA oxidase